MGNQQDAAPPISAADIHDAGGNFFDDMRVNIDKAFAFVDASLAGKQRKIFRERSSLFNKMLFRRDSWLKKHKLLETLIMNGLGDWFEEFELFWRLALSGRPLSVMDFHNLRFHYRKNFQSTTQQEWGSKDQHMSNWQEYKNIHILFQQVYSNALNPFRPMSFLGKGGRNILEYGCSIAPYYRCWRKYFNHIPAEWTFADIKQISYLFSKFSYAGAPGVKKFIDIDQHNMHAPLAPEDEKYDVVILTTVLEHLHNPYEISEHLLEHLKPGGLLVFDYIKSEAIGSIPHRGWPCVKKRCRC